MESRLPNILKHVAEKLGLKEWTYTREQWNHSIENYFGVLIPVTLVGNDDTKQVLIPLVVKFAPNTSIEELRIVTKQQYETEIYTYTVLIPIYKRLTNLNLDIFFPECYITNLEEERQFLVLSDMRSKGYQRYAQSNLDVDHTITSLKALAKFHALSIIYKEKGNHLNKEIMKPYSKTHPEIYHSYIKNSLKKHLNLFVGTIYENYMKSLEKDLASNIHQASSDVKYLIYGHGDFWKENLLFKYENERPIQACVLDLQKSRIMSPAQDLIQFLVTNVEIVNIKQHLQDFLQTYLNELHSILQENDLTAIYSINDLNNDIKIVVPYSLSIIFMTYSLFFGLENGDILQSKNTCDDKAKAEALYKNTVNNVLEYMNTVNYITL